MWCRTTDGEDKLDRSWEKLGTTRVKYKRNILQTIKGRKAN